MRIDYIVATIILFVFVFVSYQNSRYVINDDDQVVITQFGKVVGKAHTVPGEYFKVPFIQKAHYFKKIFYVTEIKQEIPTRDKKYVLLSTRSFWKISAPIKYYKNLNNYNLAEKFIMKHIGAAEREVITSQILSDLTNKFDNTGSKYEIEDKIKSISKPYLLEAGISLLKIEAKLTSTVKAK